jgi:DNA-binding IclR family transcriptional regulator
MNTKTHADVAEEGCCLACHVLDLLRESRTPMTHITVARRLGEPRQKVRNILGYLVTKEEVRMTSRGTFAFPKDTPAA